MVRPRLVQQGVPLYGPGSNTPRADDGSISDHSMEDGHHHVNSSFTISPDEVGVSSLQRAAAAATGATGGRKRTTSANPRSRATSYVVGGGVSASAPASAPSEQLNYTVPPVPYPQNQWMGDAMAQTPAQQYMQATTMTPIHSVDNQNQHHHQDSSMDMEAEHIMPPAGSYQIHDSHQHQMQPAPLSTPAAPNHISLHNPHAYEVGQPQTNTTAVTTSYVIGGENALPAQSAEKMEGVQDHGTKMPLVVLDGANVAHAYTNAMSSMNDSYRKQRNGKSDPDARGILVAADYFLSVGVRVLIVLPQYWLRKKPRPGDSSSHQNAMMETAQHDILKNLDDRGLIVSSPPADDDDAYALTIAKREETRALRQRNGEGPGFVLSNDMFRDAQARDSTGILEQWLNNGRNETIGPGRISFAFCDMGTMDYHGDRILDFVPNPRHPFVIFVEGLHHQVLANR
eukprot:scaffold2844_cov123-Cylindrotheca_fusiformis.AAC.7